MSAENKVSAFLRMLTQPRSNFSKHPQRWRIAAAVYVFACLTFVLVAVLALDIAGSVALAYLIGFAAIGFSAVTLHRVSAVKVDGLPALPAIPSEIIAAVEGVQRQQAEAKVAPTIEAAVEWPVSASAAPVEALAEAPQREPKAAVEPYAAITPDGGSTPAPAGPAAVEIAFERSPIVTLPQRKLGLIHGAVTGTPLDLSPVQESEILLAHAVAFATQHKAGIGRSLMIDLSVAALDDQEFLNDVLDILDSAPGLAERMIFALPESGLTSSEYGLQRRLQALREEGMQFAGRLERTLSPADFITHGSAWSGFAYFLMPVQTVLESGEGVIELLQSLEVRLVATGVTSDEQVLELLDRKVPLAAGPLFLGSTKPAATAEKPKANRKPRAKAQPASPTATKLVGERGSSVQIAAEVKRNPRKVRRPEITVPHGPPLTRIEKARRQVAAASGASKH